VADLCKLLLAAVVTTLFWLSSPLVHCGTDDNTAPFKANAFSNQVSHRQPTRLVEGATTVLAQAVRSRQPSSVAEKVIAPDKAPETSSTNVETVQIPDRGEFQLLSRDPLDLIQLDNIQPLYTSPAIPGEGVWESSGSPRDSSGRPVVYKTFYRPSVDFPNAVVYMMVVDMSKTFMQYYVGSQEPGAHTASSEVEPDMRSRIMAVTNAMWMQRHSLGAGAIFRGKVIYPLVADMATLIVYKDGSIDIREWSPDIPISLIRDARQLRHLIVKNGMVVQSIVRKGRVEDSEIGLGFLLGGGGRDQDGKHFWYVAHRSAFGIRKDGNLVFAIGHHIGSKDLAKALVLAGSERGIHADANPDNIVGNLYVRDSYGNLVTKLKLSPEQSKYTLKRYEDKYSKDFFAFFLRENLSPTGNALTRGDTPIRTHP
jgi:hypothetical protein